MRKAGWTPSIVPGDGADQTVYLVAEDFGAKGSAWRETNARPPISRPSSKTFWQVNTPNQFGSSLSTPQRWSEDVSVDFAHELRRRCDEQMRPLPLQEFTDRFEGRYSDVQLPLPMRLV